MFALPRAKFVPLFALVSLALNPTGLLAEDVQERSKLVGKKEDSRRIVGYEAMSSKQSPLIGFEFGIGNKSPFVQVSAFRPIFKGDETSRPAAGLFADATVKGRKVKTPVHTTEKVVAKDGYAVSKVVVQYGLWIDSIQVHFARIKGDGLNLGDTYYTNYLGSTEARGAYTTLDSEGRLIVGVTGTMDDVKAVGFGLVYSGKAPPKPVKAAPVMLPQSTAPEPTGGLDMKPAPGSGSRVQLPAFDPPAQPAPANPGKSAPAKPAPREMDPAVKAKIEQQNAEAAKQFAKLSGEFQQQQAELRKQLATVPKWDPAANQEAGQEAMRKALDEAEAREDLTADQRAELAQLRKMFGLEPKSSLWMSVAVGLGVCGLVGAGAYFFMGRNAGPLPKAGRRLPVARRVADDVDAEPLDVDDDEADSPHDSRRPARD
ncbi:hypothetical protein [Limnoglobus roseus]|uniref:Serine protease n=1 Tax=Limnoglobus roseus TaxID=2598579 RepID=A0A5C1A6K9_9BACT|nr:hypothetical protein [Limnoglobus roseus]QEL13893.1 serine protease [Limnoglobus roseus]